jgi:predicted negative regulator of RcsB-dependent stress response
MSLLADLLSKVEYQGIKGGIPPNLKQVVADSTERSAIIKKVVILSILVVIAVTTGFGVVYVFQAYIKPAAVKNTVSMPQPGNLQAAAMQSTAPPLPPSSPAQVTSPAPPVPAEPAPQKKPLSKKKDVTAISAKDEEASVQQGQVSRVPDQADGKTAAVIKEQKPPSSDESDKRDMYLYSAKASESRKDYQQALSNYMKALELDPGNAGTYIIMNNIAGIMIQLGRYDEALHYAGTALTLKKDYSPSLINMGIASIKMDNTEEGKKYLARALTLNPSNRSALLNLALLQEKTAEYDNAYSSFYRLAELGDIQGYLGLARVAEKKGKNSDAARIYREILSINNIDPHIKKLAGERLLQVEQ